MLAHTSGAITSLICSRGIHLRNRIFLIYRALSPWRQPKLLCGEPAALLSLPSPFVLMARLSWWLVSLGEPIQKPCNIPLSLLYLLWSLGFVLRALGCRSYFVVAALVGLPAIKSSLRCLPSQRRQMMGDATSRQTLLWIF